MRNRGIPMVNAIIAITECALVVYAPPSPKLTPTLPLGTGFIRANKRPPQQITHV